MRIGPKAIRYAGPMMVYDPFGVGPDIHPVPGALPPGTLCCPFRASKSKSRRVASGQRSAAVPCTDGRRAFPSTGKGQRPPDSRIVPL